MSFRLFRSKQSLAREQEKQFESQGNRKELKHLNIWQSKLTQGNYYSLFKAGTRLNYNYKEGEFNLLKRKHH